MKCNSKLKLLNEQYSQQLPECFVDQSTPMQKSFMWIIYGSHKDQIIITFSYSVRDNKTHTPNQYLLFQFSFLPAVKLDILLLPIYSLPLLTEPLHNL